MTFPPAFPLVLAFLAALLVVIVVMIELGILRYAYAKIGIPSRYMFVVLVLSLIGSHVNVPLYAVPVVRLLPSETISVFGRTYTSPPIQEEAMTIVAINLGGASSDHRSSTCCPLELRGLICGHRRSPAGVHSLAQIVPGVGSVPFWAALVAGVVALVLARARAPAWTMSRDR